MSACLAQAEHPALNRKDLVKLQEHAPFMSAWRNKQTQSNTTDTRLAGWNESCHEGANPSALTKLHVSYIPRCRWDHSHDNMASSPRYGLTIKPLPKVTQDAKWSVWYCPPNPTFLMWTN